MKASFLGVLVIVMALFLLEIDGVMFVTVEGGLESLGSWILSDGWCEGVEIFESCDDVTCFFVSDKS